MAPSRRLAELYYEISARTDNLSKDLGQAERQFGKLTSFVLKNPVTAMATFAASVAAIGIAAAKAADQVEAPLRRIASLTAGGAEGIGALRAELTLLSRESGRSQAELAAAAEEAAKTESTTAGISANLRAAVRLSEATGADLTTVLQNLDTVLDLFGHSAGQSAEDLALLFSVAKGNAPIGEVFATIQAAGPGIARLGLDLDTVSKALVALGTKLGSPKAAATEFKKLSQAGQEGKAAIEALAASVTLAADPMKELADAAKAATNNVAGEAARASAEWQATWIDFGRSARAILLPTLRSLTELLATLRGTVSVGFGQRAFDDLAESIEGATTKARDRFGALTSEFQKASDATQRLSRAFGEGAFSFAGKGAKELEELIVQLISFKQSLPDVKGFDHVRTALNDLINGAIDAKNKLDAIDRKPKTAAPLDSDRIAQAAKDREAALKAANDALDQFRDKQQAAGEAGAEFTRLQAEGFLNLAQIIGNTVKLIDAEILSITDAVRKAGKDGGFSEAEIQTAVDTATAHLVAAKNAAQAFNGALAEIRIPPELKDKLAGPLTEIREGLKETRKALIALGVSAADIDEIISREEIERVRALLEGLGLSEAQIRKLVGPLTDAKSAALEAADAIRSIGNAVISILGAFNALSQELQDLSRGIVNIGAGIADIAGGNLLAGSIGVLGGVADIVKGITGGDEEAERRHQEAQRALDAIEKHTGDLVGRNVTGNQLARASAAVSAIDFGVTSNRFQFNEQVRPTLERLGLSFDELKETAAAFGITLTTSKQSWLDFKAALDAIDLSALRDTFEGQLDIGAQRRRITGTENAQQELIDTAQALAKFSPEFKKVFEGLDLTVAEDRVIALQRIMETFERALAGEIDLGDLNIEQFLEGLGLSADLIRELMPELGEAFNEALKGLDSFRKNVEAFAMSMQGIDLAEQFGALDPDQVLDAKIQAFGKSFADAAGQIDFSSLESFKTTAANLIAGFFADGELTEAERAQINALTALLGAFEAAEAGALSLAATLQAAFADIDLDAVIFGEGAADTFNKKVGEIGLGTFDVSTQAGRDAARAALQELARTDATLKPIIAALIRDLDNLPDLPGAIGDAVAGAVGGERSSISSAAQALTERTGNRMADYLATGIVLQRRQISLLEQLVSGAVATQGVVLTPPALSSIVPLTTTTVSGGLTLNVGSVSLTIHAATSDPETLGDLVTKAFVRQLATEVSQVLASDTLQTRRFSGDARLTS